MLEEDAYRRYLKFKNVTFGESPQDLWKGFYQSLLPIERGLVYGDAIGEVTEFLFRFEVTDPHPIREKPMPYKKEERAWIRNYINNQVELGILEAVGPGEKEPTFVVGCVLVREGQSGQSYRLCANLV